jgi:predicted nucleic acid-binding Zn ribbon protein
MSDFTRLGDIVARAMRHVVLSDEARAYEGWAKTAGDDVAAVTRPRRFARGLLTVECESAAWANELTYLTPMILKRLAADDPETPVTKLRFVTSARSLTKEDGSGAAKNQE